MRGSHLPEEIALSENYLLIGVRELLRMGLALVRVWRGRAVGIAPAEGLKLRRQMAAAAKQARVGAVVSFHGGE